MMHRKRNAPKIKWSLFVSFTALTAFILLLFWVLQLLLLDTVYDWTTRSRMQNLLYEIGYATQADTFAEDAVSLSENAETAMAVYRVEKDGFFLIAENAERDGVLHLFDSADVQTLYQRTLEKDGVLQGKLGDVLSGSYTAPQQKGRLLSAFIAKGTAGQTYLILLDTALAPLYSVFRTMQNQLSLISVVLLAVSAGIAFLLARHIAAPIERISKKAKRMSDGAYHIDFSEKSYREIEELSETLNQASDELSKLDRLQKELIANISHDLRTPLTMIVGYAEVMRDIEGENNPENIQVIIDEATRLSALVNDLLEISRIQGERSIRKDERFDLVLVAKETVERYRRLKENSGFAFRFEGEGEGVVCADRGKLTQVLCNLINNAINYSDEDRSILVRAISKDGAVRVEVIDHGRGISPENLDKVWQRYYRDERNHRRSIAGSGLGLSIVREILDLHHARYGVSSLVGEGSTFWFEIPCDRSDLLPQRV